jgi:hypothetical protein
MKTIINFLLDETGSMMSVKQQTIEGFNEYLNSMRKEKVDFKLTKFNSSKTEIHDTKPAKDYPELTYETYVPDATTPLYDAIGRSVRSLENDLKEKKRKVLMVIMTDGLENASQEYNRDAIFKLVSEKEKDGWTFVYLGANQDSWAVAEPLGFNKGNVTNYDPHNTVQTYNMAAQRTASYLSKGNIGNFFDDKDVQ